MKNHSVILLVLLLSISCSTLHKSSRLQQMNWVLGTWKMTSDEGFFIETWAKQNDTLIQGSGFFIVGSDTPFREELLIVDRNDTLYYAAATPKNGEEPVYFKERSLNQNEAVFENPEHDFPQQISYKKLNGRNIIATISGTYEGERHSETFNLMKQ